MLTILGVCLFVAITLLTLPLRLLEAIERRNRIRKRTRRASP